MNKFCSDIRVIKTKPSKKNPGTYLKDLVTKSLDFLFHNSNSVLLIASAGTLRDIFLLLCLFIQSDRTLHEFLPYKYLPKPFYFSLLSVIILVSNAKSSFLTLHLETSSAWWSRGLALSIHI